MGSPAKSRTALLLATTLAVLSLIYGVMSLPRYGLTYDAPALFYAGDRTLYSIQHPSEKGALDLDQPGEPPNFTTRFVRNPAFDDPIHYPVLPGLVSAVTSRVFHDRLHLLDD